MVRVYLVLAKRPVILRFFVARSTLTLIPVPSLTTTEVASSGTLVRFKIALLLLISEISAEMFSDVAGEVVKDFVDVAVELSV